MKKNISRNQLELPLFEQKVEKKFEGKVLEEKIEYIKPKNFKQQATYEIRHYQEECIAKIIKENIPSSLVVYPAGSGKTFIASRIIDQVVDSGKVLVLSPRVSLSYQLANYFKKFFTFEEEIVVLAGKTSKQRQKFYQNAKILVSTPQGIANDLKKIKWDFKLVVFDEVDFGVGNYQYVEIAKIAQQNKTPAIGLSATIGQIEKIKNLLTTFGFKKLFIKLENESDIKPLRREINLIKRNTPFSENYKKMYDIIESIFNEYLEKIKEKIDIDFIFQKKYINIEDLQEIKKEIEETRDGYFYLVSLYATILNLYELKRIILEESKEQIKKRIKKLLEEAQKNKRYAKNILDSIKKTAFLDYLKQVKSAQKIDFFIEDIREEKQSCEKENKKLKAIVVCNSKEFVNFLTKKLQEININARIYVGKGEGFSKKQQLEVLESFLNGELEVIVSTKAAIERGIDLPNADKLFILNPSGSEKSYIQLLNRINREKSRGKGEIYVYCQGDYELLKSIISKTKKEKYEITLVYIKKLIEEEEQKLPEFRRTLLEIISEVEEKFKEK
ncbi:MAG: DEAD/DEAH box helicase [Candidatus Anstonellaceae archaeon]